MGEVNVSAAVQLLRSWGVSPDYLINGTLEDKASNSIADQDLLNQFKKIEQLSNEKKKIVKEFLDAFIFKSNIQNQLSS